MKNILRVIHSDFKRLRSNVVALVILLGLCVLPCLYAWFNILSNWDPYGSDSTKNLNIAVYTCDVGANVAGVKVNIGDNVVEGLHANKAMGWVFTDSKEDAIEGVYASDYYAAIIIPADFTQNMVSFLQGEVTNPYIVYYENDKKNAIAPKITSKAQKAVKESVNSAFISTLGESLFEVTGSLTLGAEGTGMMDSIVDKLTRLDEDLDAFCNVVEAYAMVTDDSGALLDTVNEILPDIEGTTDYGRDAVSYLQSMVNLVSEYESKLDYSQYKDKINPDNVDLSDEQKQKLEDAQNRVDQAQKELEEAEKKALEDAKNSEAGQKVTNSEAAQKASDAIEAEQITEESVKKLREDGLNLVNESLKNTLEILNEIDVDYDGISDSVTKLRDGITDTTLSLSETAKEARDLQEKVEKLRDDMTEFMETEEYEKLKKIFTSNPEELSDFLSSPVALVTEEIYPVTNYGSAMAPFYTVLALWVGALILVPVVHCKVTSKDLQDVKPWQAFFGRYFIFFLLSQTQALITTFGDLFYLDIQCTNPFLFWVGCSVSSFAFSIFIYSLTVAFGNIGEALAVVIMVIQVAGAGGSFPKEVLPEVFQMVYKYLPFAYSMNGLRECVAGIYENDFWKDMGALMIVVAVSLVIGLLLAIPMRRLMEIIEESKEETEVMI